MRTLITCIATVAAIAVTASPAAANAPLSSGTATRVAHAYIGGGGWHELTARAQREFSTPLEWCHGYVGAPFDGVRETRRRIVYQVAASCRTATGADVWVAGEAVVRQRHVGVTIRFRRFVAV